MKVREVTLSKDFKLGLANFSNITVGIAMTFEVGDDEKVSWDDSWDTINHQISLQTSIDPAWMKSEDLKENYKFTVKVPKTRVEFGGEGK